MSRAFLPYGRQSVDEDDIAAVVGVLRSDYLTTGPAVAAFEQALADRVGAKYAVAVSNGTAALHAACAVLGLGPGDEVIVPAISFVASANCVAYTGAQPVFADVDPDSGLVVVDDIARRITRRTRAVIPVHLNGQPADLRPLRGLGLPVLADAAHALGATYQGLPIGDPALADLAILSFHPVKHITTGEGGAIVTSDERLYRRLRVFRDHGIVRDSGSFEQAAPGPWYYEQQQLGHNLRLCDLQCALGTSQLTKLDRFVARRREIAARYTQRLQALPHVTPVAQGTESAFHLFPVLIDFAALGRSRAQVMAELRARQIGSQVHYIPIPAQPYYAHLGYTLLGLEGAQRYYDRVLSLPMYPALSDADVDYVVESLAAIVRT